MQRLADSDETDIVRIYVLALQNIRASNPTLAVELLETVWTRQIDHEEDQGKSQAKRAAGVALAAHDELFDGLESVPNAGDILDQLDRDELFGPEVVVYDQLSGASVDEDPDDLLAQADAHEKVDNTISASENRAFAVLLSSLRD